MDTVEYYRRAADLFESKLHGAAAEKWTNPTPCTDWNVRDLVNHLVYEVRWMPPLLDGKTIDEVGDQFDGDLLGHDPQGAWDSAKKDSFESVGDIDLEQKVNVSFGQISADDYIAQVATDLVIHAWDLAKGLEIDDRLDPELVEEAYQRFAPYADAARSSGVYGPEVTVPDSADRQAQLLAISGREP